MKTEHSKVALNFLLIILIINNVKCLRNEMSMKDKEERFEDRSLQLLNEDGKCERLEQKACLALGYNFTKMPNSYGSERQKEALMEMDTYKPLIQLRCSDELVPFLCSVFFPMCNAKIPASIGKIKYIEPYMPCH